MANKHELNLDKAFKRFSTYLPVAFDFNRRDVTNAIKLYKRISAVIEGQPIDDATAALAMLLGQTINQWHDRRSLRKQSRRKAA